MTLADAARDSGNWDEAHRYYTQALEYDAENASAWVGKGLASGRLSTLTQNRLSEVLTCFKKALSLTSDDRLSPLEDHLAGEIIYICQLYYENARAHLNNFIGSHPGTWNDYIAHCAAIIDSTAYAFSLRRGDRRILDFGIAVCRDVLGGRTFNDPGTRTPRSFSVTPSAGAHIHQRHMYFAAELQALLPPQPPPMVTTPTKGPGLRVWLALGILCAPYIFAWFTLAPTFSKLWKIVSFAWLGLLILMVVVSPPPISRPPQEHGSSGVPSTQSPPPPAVQLALAKQQLAQTPYSREQVLAARDLLAQIPKEAPDYGEAQALLKKIGPQIAKIEADDKRAAALEAARRDPIDVVKATWEKGGFGVIGVWHVTLKNRSDKPVADIEYETAYSSESGNDVGSGSGTIQKVIEPGATRTFEVNDGFIQSEAARASFVVKKWRLAK
jgi:tetratricopeptide (TPR) repeat protein